jgi:hypothetical protein
MMNWNKVVWPGTVSHEEERKDLIRNCKDKTVG